MISAAEKKDQGNDFTIKNLGKAEITSSLTEKQNFIDDNDRVLRYARINFVKEIELLKNINNLSFEKSGPRKKIYFNPRNVKVAIVTCGGLCPGLNSVIRGLVRQLWNRYEVKNIVGIRYGYHGLGNKAEKFINLAPEIVEDIHNTGGTFLGTSRGSPPSDEIVNNLVKNNINILFIIGGDGTMRGGHAICKEIEKRNLKISVIGIPKTIDNDIPYVSKSFGFETAVEKASNAVLAAHEEARAHNRGIGLVKVMGRQTGFIAASTAMSTGVVNLCLIPEVSFTLCDKSGIIPYLKERFKKTRHAVIVVAEGAGQDLFEPSDNKKTDASGNPVLPDIGTFLKSEINNLCKKEKIEISLKYIDPSYIIRSAPPNCYDKIFCARMAQNAVHAAMAGKTEMLIGYWNEMMTHIPFSALTGQTKRINPLGTLWFNVMETTMQTIGK